MNKKNTKRFDTVPYKHADGYDPLHCNAWIFSYFLGIHTILGVKPGKPEAIH